MSLGRGGVTPPGVGALRPPDPARRRGHNRLRTLVLAVVLPVLGGCGLVAEPGAGTTEPAYEGHALSHWIEMMQRPEADRRTRAVDVVHEMRIPRGPLMLPAVPALCDVVENPGDALATRRKALWVVWRILQDPAVEAVPLVPCFTSALAASDPQLRGGAAIILGEIGPEAHEAAPALRTLVHDPDPTVARYVRWAVGRVGSDEGRSEARPSTPRGRAPP